MPQTAEDYARSARTLYNKITKGYTLQHGAEKIYYRLVPHYESIKGQAKNVYFLHEGGVFSLDPTFNG
jgi:hypothetical protein